MVVAIKLSHDLKWLETQMRAVAGPKMIEGAHLALFRTVAGARRDIMEVIPRAFDEPTRFTTNSVRFTPPSRGSLDASVYISDDAAKGLSPRKYLGPGIGGGPRNRKRSEKALDRMGMIGGNWIIPGRGTPLDRHGNVQSGFMMRVLSRLAASGEVGYRANAGAKTRQQLQRAKRAIRSTGTDFFIGKSRKFGTPLAVYQLVGRGRVVPVLALVRKAPQYRVRFDFPALVEESVDKRWPKEIDRAMVDAMAWLTKGKP